MLNTNGEKSPESKRQKTLRSRRKAAGLVRFDKWVTPEQAKEFNKILKQAP
jgi:hypothetical protein